MGHEVTPAVPEREMGSLYSLGQDHIVKEHVGKLDISNGLAWSHDNKIMYFIDSCLRKVYAFDFDIEAGTLCKLLQNMYVYTTDIIKRAASPENVTLEIPSCFFRIFSETPEICRNKIR